MIYPAHIKKSENGEKTVQTVKEHSIAVAKIAGKSLEPAGMSHVGYLAGLLHDMGKYQKAFADYIEKASEGEKVKRGSVIHTFQGCRYILEHYHSFDEKPVLSDIPAEIIAYAIAAHHGLFDCCGPDMDEHGFVHRLKKEGTAYKKTEKSFLADIDSSEDLTSLYDKAKEECMDVIGKIQDMEATRAKNMQREKIEGWKIMEIAGQEISFYLGMQARMLLSSVIHGDRKDTAQFMRGAASPAQEEYRKDFSSFWNAYLETVDRKLDGFPAETQIQKSRRQISEQCRVFASHGTGVYRLNVPTGSGKTLSSLRFALRHASIHKKRRIIFVAPLLSILDQNAKIIKESLEDDSVVLEHYSVLGEETEEKRTYPSAEYASRAELMAEDWSAPVVITSMVQFLQTLFSGKPSCIRRMQALCGSVIVIDEVQTIPNRILSLFNLATNFLSEICGATFLLCSATQPCLEEAQHPLIKEPENVVPYDQELWKPFKRTRLRIEKGKKLSDMPVYILRHAQSVNSLLVVCNKKSEAEFLFKNLQGRGCRLFHLSASMCMAHRKGVLSTIREELAAPADNQPLICISTQVIEAGVDISFDKAIRFAAGMDSAIQTDGRCNRNGEYPSSDVIIVLIEDENLSRLDDIKRGKDATIGLLAAYENDRSLFDGSLTSDKAIQYYYKRLYAEMFPGYQDYPLGEKARLAEGTSILSLLSDNIYYNTASRPKYLLNQGFAKAGALFQVFDDCSTDIVAPYKEGRDLIRKLAYMHDEHKKIPFEWMNQWVKRAKPYTVSVYSYQLSRLESQGGIYRIGDITVLNEDFYDSEGTGVITQESNGIFL